MIAARLKRLMKREADFWTYNMVICLESGLEITTTVDLDSGAATNVISDEMVEKWGLETSRYFGKPYRTLTGELIQPDFTAELSWRGEHSREVFRGTFIVVKGSQADVLLGRPMCQNLGFAFLLDVLARPTATFQSLFALQGDPKSGENRIDLVKTSADLKHQQPSARAELHRQSSNQRSL